MEEVSDEEGTNARLKTEIKRRHEGNMRRSIKETTATYVIKEKIGKEMEQMRELKNRKKKYLSEKERLLWQLKMRKKKQKGSDGRRQRTTEDRKSQMFAREMTDYRG